ncbi:RNA polymerase sigma factor [Saccharicrinis sp. FJH54]|uniref:RNA polymerase sigma factor n=1 Tax=Saccharicrinis sp. FJH54 TaxID=3344665 RepID=UPI0035D44714
MTSFDTVYKDNYPGMYGIAFRMVNDRDAVSDIVQEVFLYFFQKQQNGHEINNIKSWLFRATINKCIDYSRQLKNRVDIGYVEKLNVTEEHVDVEPGYETVHKALLQLKPKDRALVLLYSEGLSYREISEVSGIKVTSVGKTLSRILQKLNERLKKMNYEVS